MKRKHAALFGLVGLLAASPAGAGAFFDSGDANVVSSENGRHYMSMGVAAYFFEGPRRHNVGGLYEEDGSVTDHDVQHFEPDFTTVLFGGTIGHVVEPGDASFGQNLRVEATGHYLVGEDSKSERLRTDQWWDYLGLNGSGYIDDLIGPGGLRGFEFDVDYRYFDAGLAVRTDFALPALDAVVTPSVGLAVHRLTENHDIVFLDLGGGAFEFNRIDEEVETWYTGVTLGGQVRIPILEGLSVQLGGTTWLSYADSDYRGEQRFMSQPGGSHETDSLTKFSFRATAKAGITYACRLMTASVTGGVDHWGYAPVIRNPEAPIGVMYSSVAVTDPAGLNSDTMTNYFVGATVSFNLDELLGFIR